MHGIVACTVTDRTDLKEIPTKNVRICLGKVTGQLHSQGKHISHTSSTFLKQALYR